MLFDYQAAAPRKLGLSLCALFFSLSSSLGLAYAVSGNPLPERPDRSYVDPRLQNIAEDEVQAAQARHRATSAAVVVVESRTGHVLAFAEAGTSGWDTRAIGPGSVIKPLIVSAAMAAGLVTPDTIIDCREPLVIDGLSFHDDVRRGLLSMKEVIAQSSNIGSIRVGQQLGLEGIKSALAAFGIPDETIHPGDSDGLRLARLSFGQTVSTTISAVARAYGKLASSDNDALKNMLVYAVTNGTGRRAALPGYAVAGKTGTMRIEAPRPEEGDSVSTLRETILASFVGFVPSDATEIVIYAIIENPHGPLTSGGAVAAPLFQRVAARSLNPR